MQRLSATGIVRIRVVLVVVVLLALISVEQRASAMQTRASIIHGQILPSLF
jgi:hypothetical protein